jgi:phosphotransferase system HPr-like phosphotransfer protein
MALGVKLHKKEVYTLKKFAIKLHSIDDVRRFVTAASLQVFEIDIVTGRYIVDAKSIMGLFSLDLSKPIFVEAHGEPEETKEFFEIIKEFAAKE